MSLYLVTGGAGFIGSHIAQALIARGDRVRVLDDLSSGKTANLAPHEVGEAGSGAPVEFVQGEVADAAAVERACEGVYGVFHEAAPVSVPRSIEDPEASYRTNVMGTLRVLEGARRAGAQRVVFAASSAAYGNSETLPKHEEMLPSPLSPYASGKVAAEHLLQVWGEVHGLKTVSLRYFNVFGPRQTDDSPYTGVIALFARALLRGERVRIYGDGEQSRDFTYVDNVVQANLRAMEAEVPSGRVYNVGAGDALSINELYSTMAAQLGVEQAPEYMPDRAGDVKHSLASLERIRAELGYEPNVSWREGLATTVEWYRGRFEAAAAS